MLLNETNCEKNKKEEEKNEVGKRENKAEKWCFLKQSGALR